MARINVLFGAGVRAEKFLIQYYNQIEISEVFDNVKTDDFLGCYVKKPYYNPLAFIIVTVEGAPAYFQIRKQLIELGYAEFKDFVPYTIYNKKIALAYGNCHMLAVKQFLESNKVFSEEYGFYPFPGICNLNEEYEYENILGHVELFIHQAIRRDNRYGESYASCYMINKMSDACKIVAIPNLYGLPKCFFPQLEIGVKYNSKIHPYFFVDNNIIKWLKEGKAVKEIVNNIMTGGVYSERELLDMLSEFKEKLLLREEEWDIKISDYILNNYKKEKLFCDVNHISAKLAKEIANRVLKYLNINSEIASLPIGMDDLEAFIYPDVKKALGLEFEEKFIRQFSLGASCSGYAMDFEEYIEQICSYTLIMLNGENC